MTEIWQQPEQQQQQQKFAIFRLFLTYYPDPTAFLIRSFFTVIELLASITQIWAIDFDKAGMSKQNNSIEI